MNCLNILCPYAFWEQAGETVKKSPENPEAEILSDCDSK